MITARRLLALGALLVAAAVFAAEISIDADRTVDFTAFKTYAWKGGTPTADAALNADIVADIDEQLAAKGLKKVEKAPDLYVHYHAKQRDDVKITDWDEGKFKFANRNITESWAKVGTLAVDLVDPKTGTVLWRAAVTDTLKSKTVTPEFKEMLKRNIALMFTQYPPKKS